MTVSLKNAPWLHEHAIERHTMEILYEYGNKVRRSIVPPIPVERIAEKLIGYNVELCTDELYDNPTLLGGIYFNEKVIRINGAIENQEGRYNFTIAHEIGHFKLHKHWLEGQRNQQTLFSKKDIPEILCREGEAKKNRGEHQADMFASLLLMPEHFVKDAFHSLFKENVRFPKEKESSFLMIPPEMKARKIAEQVIHAGNFRNVSKTAMVNRLIGMELIEGIEYQKNGPVYDFEDVGGLTN